MKEIPCFTKKNDKFFCVTMYRNKIYVVFLNLKKLEGNITFHKNKGRKILARFLSVTIC